MFNIKNWIMYLKDYEPRIVSMTEQSTLMKHVSYISKSTGLKRNTIYIGRFSDVAYRFLSLNGITIFLIKTDDEIEQIKYGDNCVVLFPQETNMEELFESCKEYLKIQDEVIENNQKLMDFYLLDSSLQSVLDCVAEILENPLMVIDNGYRVVGFSNSKDCEDLQWLECIKTGYCSYEFVSQFNKLSEIASAQKETSPVLAGCLMSPMRRCVSRMFVDKKPIGYLLSIESMKPFDEAKVVFLEVAAKLLSKILAFTALKNGQDIYHSTWDAMINAIEEIPGSVETLREYIRNSGMRINSQYYLILLSLDHYKATGHQMAPFYNIFRDIFPNSVFSFYKNNVLIIVEYPDGYEALKDRLESRREFFAEKNIRVAVSDSFHDFSNMNRYYRQAKQVVDFMSVFKDNALICIYDEIRTYDMILSRPRKQEMPLFIREREKELFEYDKEHGTELYKTLYSYIKNGKSLQDTADELFIHKNTVSYRVNRIRELFGLDLNDAEARIGLYLAYQTMELIEKMNGGDEL